MMAFNKNFLNTLHLMKMSTFDFFFNTTVDEKNNLDTNFDIKGLDWM